MALLINDGFTWEDTVPARGRFPSVTFRYRPALPEDVFDYLHAPKPTGKDVLRVAARLLAKHLVSWDVTDDKGDAVPVSEDVLRRVPHPVLVKMVDVVTGYGPDAEAADLKN
jgi:hypothetical protein